MFNRAEVYLTTDPERAGQIKNFLADNGFEYDMKVRPLNYLNGMHHGSLSKHTTEYRIYVHKKEADYVLHLLAQNSRKMQ